MVGHEGHRGWLYKLAVLPEFQGKGLGRDLVRQAERWLVARGVPKVNLMIRDTNIKVREFYQLEKMWLPQGAAKPLAAETV